MKNDRLIIDSFIFYNEIQLLKFRFEELYNYVDKFLIVESKKTFVGKPKPLYFLENKNIFEKYIDKVEHVIIDFEQSENAWENERFQRSSIMKGLESMNLKDEDLIIISDLDEIPDIENILKHDFSSLKPKSLAQDMYYFNINTYVNEKTNCSIVSPFKSLKEYGNPQKIREEWNTFERINKGGWHFSYFGDIEFIKNKIQNFSHQELNNLEFTNEDHIKNCIENAKDLFNRGDKNASMRHLPTEENKYLPKNYKLLYGI